MAANNHTITEEEQVLLSDIGKMYRDKREEEGFTQREAAKLAKSSQARVSSIENGHTDVGVIALQRWADVYGYSLQIVLVPYEGLEEWKTDAE